LFHSRLGNFLLRLNSRKLDCIFGLGFLYVNLSLDLIRLCFALHFSFLNIKFTPLGLYQWVFHLFHDLLLLYFHLVFLQQSLGCVCNQCGQAFLNTLRQWLTQWR
jgi:hypothetical protein